MLSPLFQTLDEENASKFVKPSRMGEPCMEMKCHNIVVKLNALLFCVTGAFIC